MLKPKHFTIVFISTLVFLFISGQSKQQKNKKKLLHELNMVGIKMVYLPNLINKIKLDSLLNEAGNLFDIIQNNGNDEEKSEACKIYSRIRMLYKKKIELFDENDNEKKQEKEFEPPKLLMSSPITQGK